MENKRIFNLGARTLKTALAVFLCLLFNMLVTKTNHFYGPFAAILCMTPTTEESIIVGINRTIGTVISGIFSAIVLVVFNFFPEHRDQVKLILIPLFIILMIEVCIKIKRPQAISITCAVFLVLSMSSTIVLIGDIVVYILVRVFETLIGIVIGTLVNRFVFPYREKSTEE